MPWVVETIESHWGYGAEPERRLDNTHSPELSRPHNYYPFLQFCTVGVNN